MSSTISLVAYHNRMMMNNDNNGDMIMEPINMPQLSCVTPGGQNNQVSMVADLNNNMTNQHISFKGPILNNSIFLRPSCADVDNNINI